MKIYNIASKYTNITLAHEEGLIKDTNYEELPPNRELYEENIPYKFEFIIPSVYFLYRYVKSKKRLYQTCIHYMLENECPHYKCAYSFIPAANKRLDSLIERYPDLDISSYCKHMYKKDTCKLCFFAGREVKGRCKCGQLIKKCTNRFNCR